MQWVIPWSELDGGPAIWGVLLLEGAPAIVEVQSLGGVPRLGGVPTLRAVAVLEGVSVLDGVPVLDEVPLMGASMMDGDSVLVGPCWAFVPKSTRMLESAAVSEGCCCLERIIAGGGRRGAAIGWDGHSVVVEHLVECTIGVTAVDKRLLKYGQWFMECLQGAVLPRMMNQGLYCAEFIALGASSSGVYIDSLIGRFSVNWCVDEKLFSGLC